MHLRSTRGEFRTSPGQLGPPGIEPVGQSEVQQIPDHQQPGPGTRCQLAPPHVEMEHARNRLDQVPRDPVARPAHAKRRKRPVIGFRIGQMPGCARQIQPSPMPGNMGRTFESASKRRGKKQRQHGRQRQAAPIVPAAGLLPWPHEKLRQPVVAGRQLLARVARPRNGEDAAQLMPRAREGPRRQDMTNFKVALATGTLLLGAAMAVAQTTGTTTSPPASTTTTPGTTSTAPAGTATDTQTRTTPQSGTMGTTGTTGTNGTTGTTGSTGTTTGQSGAYGTTGTTSADQRGAGTAAGAYGSSADQSYRDPTSGSYANREARMRAGERG